MKRLIQSTARLLCCTVVLSATSAVIAAEIKPTPDQIEFFEKKIRPVLVESCYKCHSAAEKVKGGLLVDSRDGLAKGGDTAPAIVPGDLEKSLLVKAIRYTDKDLQMPPEKNGGKLSADKIADLEAWVKMGAPDPRTGAAAPKPLNDVATARAQHWAFKPIVKPAVPAPKNKSWVQTPVDAFILAKLDEKGLKPSDAADRRTLIRRVYFDLLGLPPSEAEVEAFVKDKSKDAYAKLVDHLLEQPQYGERWGRYWLDVARYADTKGYLAGGEERRYPFSHTYRDYVIRAFNEDKPYDQFIVEQLAADQLPLGEDKRALAGMGFLTLGRRFLNNTADIIDDRIDVISRGTMGLTVACARCHDHKFDPIPTKDYYSLYGVLASSEEPAEKPLLGKLEKSAQYDDYLKQKAELEAKVEKLQADMISSFSTKVRSQVGDYLLVAHEAKGISQTDKLNTLAGTRKVVPTVLRNWMTLLEMRAKQHDPVFAPWFAYAALAEKDFPKAGKELATKFAANADAAKPLNPVVAKAFAGAAPTSLKQVADLYSKVFADVDKAWTTASSGAAKQSALADKNQEALRQIILADGAPANPPLDDVKKVLARKLREGTAKTRNQIENLNWQHPGAPARGMALVDKPKPVNPHVFVRGNPANAGAQVPRQFLEVVAGPTRKPFQQGSGRLELARAIASKDNPLTARVFVNRVWGWHFGQALVRTPSDFGVRTEAPVQLALLDFLAASFIEQGWSVKKLHRLILLSNTYQQASDEKPKYSTIDPYNSYLYRANRRRLDFESMRDTLLNVAGRLDLTPGGVPVELTTEPFAKRRTVYGLIDRQNLPAMFRTFDFASPDSSSPQRFTTTVPQQALFMMNSPFVVEQARELVNRAAVKSRATDDEKVQAIYKLLYQRAPDSDEVKMAAAFLQKNMAAQPRQAITPGWKYGYGWFDPLVNHTKDYKALTNLVSGRWIPGAKFPDTGAFSHLSVTAVGGHPGTTLQLAAVRRWVAPADGFIRIDGTLAHGSKVGDGVRGRIVSSRSGKLGEWTVLNNKVATGVAKLEVKLGETVDFVTDCVSSSNNDSFTWSPKIAYVGDYGVSLSKTSWDAEKDFSAKEKKPIATLNAWEQLAQVLLLSNELMFVD